MSALRHDCIRVDPETLSLLNHSPTTRMKRELIIYIYIYIYIICIIWTLCCISYYYYQKEATRQSASVQPTLMNYKTLCRMPTSARSKFEIARQNETAVFLSSPSRTPCSPRWMLAATDISVWILRHCLFPTTGQQQERIPQRRTDEVQAKGKSQTTVTSHNIDTIRTIFSKRSTTIGRNGGSTLMNAETLCRIPAGKRS